MVLQPCPEPPSTRIEIVRYQLHEHQDSISLRQEQKLDSIGIEILVSSIEASNLGKNGVKSNDHNTTYQKRASEIWKSSVQVRIELHPLEAIWIDI